jgi:transposase
MNYGKAAPTRKSTYKWHNSFAETGCICAKKKNSGRRPSGETEESIRASFLRSPQKSTRRASRELDDVSHMTVWRVLRRDCLSGCTNFNCCRS